MKKNSPDTSSAPEPHEENNQAAHHRDRLSEILAGSLVLELQPQEVPFGHPESRCRFDIWRGDKAVVATPGALATFGHAAIIAAMELLQREAETHGGLDHLQVYLDRNGNKLWVIEDAVAITALLPDEY